MKYYIGIDIGGGSTRLGLVSIAGEVIAQECFSTQAYPEPAAYIRKLVEQIQYLAHSTGRVVSAIGIGAPNGNYYSRAIEQPPNLPWKGSFPLAQMLEQATGLTTYLTNDANAAAIGELRYGIAAQKHIDNFIMITLGTGLGSAVVVDGRLVYGHDGFAGELGHVTIVPNGRLCNCGRKGCLERYASATGLVLSAKAAMQSNGLSSSLYALAPENLTALEIYRAAEAGDAMALQVFDQTAQYLALALANACTVTSPEAFIFFGGLTNAGDLLMRPLKQYFNEYVLNLYQHKVQMLLSSIPKNQAAVLGAAALAIDQVLIA